MKPKHLLFDLDGTLTDPRDGIVRSILYSLQQFQIELPAEKDLLWCIGPPLLDSFKVILKDDAMAAQAVKHYRDRYSEIGLFENSVYSAIPSVLAELKDRSFNLWVATSKPEPYALRIIDHFQLTPYFLKVYGSEFNGTRGDKGELIAQLLMEQNILPDQAVMIGDRKHDISGAKKNKLKSVGVSWGYGSKEELKTAGADILIDSPAELITIFK